MIDLNSQEIQRREKRKLIFRYLIMFITFSLIIILLTIITNNSFILVIALMIIFAIIFKISYFISIFKNKKYPNYLFEIKEQDNKLIINLNDQKLIINKNEEFLIDVDFADRYKWSSDITIISGNKKSLTVSTYLPYVDKLDIILTKIKENHSIIMENKTNNYKFMYKGE